MSVKLMMNVLRELENTPSTNHKEDLLRVAGEKIPEFKTMLRYALDPYKKYNIIAMPAPTETATKALPIPSWETIQKILDDAASSRLSGTNLKTVIANFLSTYGPSGKLLFKRVITKDLRCGVGATLVNNVFPGLIPEFGIMLANPLQEHHMKNIRKAKAAWWQPKKNGHRVVAMIPPRYGEHKSVSRAYSRKGHELHNYQKVLHNLEFLVDQHDQYRHTGVVFDGEIITGDFFKTSEAKKLAGNEVEGAVYHMFDMVSLPMWEEQQSLPYSKRRVELAKFCNAGVFGMYQNLARVPSFPVEMDKLSLEYFDNLRDEQVKKGEEGLIIRLEGKYNHKSRASMMKHKKMETMDCMIIEVLPGEDDKKYANTAGKLLIRIDDGETLCKAGLKLSDSERDEMWKNRNLIAGQVCEVAYQDKTVSKQGVPKLQFPVYLRMREDKS